MKSDQIQFCSVELALNDTDSVEAELRNICPVRVCGNVLAPSQHSAPLETLSKAWYSVLEASSWLPPYTCVSVSRVKYTCALQDLDCIFCFFTASQLQRKQYVCACVTKVGGGQSSDWSITLTIRCAGFVHSSFGTGLEKEIQFQWLPQG